MFCSVPSHLAASAHAQPNVTGVAFRLDLAGTLSAMTRLQPTTQRLMVLSGSPIDKQSLKKAANEATPKLLAELEFIEQLPLLELVEKMQSADRRHFRTHDIVR